MMGWFSANTSDDSKRIDGKDPSREAKRDKCPSCCRLEQACAGHFSLNLTKPNRKQRAVPIKLYDNFSELETSARKGCHLCRCWLRALLNECSAPAAREALVKSKEPVFASSPITDYSPLKDGIGGSREAHFFKIWSTVEATMRLGGVSDQEFRAVSTSGHLEAASWALSRLKTCHETHSLCADLRVSDHLPTRLLDLKTPGVVKLVNGESLDFSPYVALSYCWGGDQDGKLCLESEARLRAGVDISFLSNTIQDAVSFCRDISIEYLWVDALCIMQDGDSGDWNNEAARIQYIYGNAYVTLSICSAATAIDGFIRLDDKYDLPIDPEWSKMTGMLAVSARKNLNQMRLDAPLASRGWIFQEELLSPRILYWSEQGLFWSCSEIKDAENGTARAGRDELFPQIRNPEVMDPHEFRRTADPLFLWDDMISSFSLRDFTIADDRLPAVAGLASLIGQSTGEEYIAGLWKSRLPAQLLWAVATPTDNGLSLLETKSGSESRDRKHMTPSWSWANIAPARGIIMPKQASTRARLTRIEVNDACTELHLVGRMRTMTEGLGHLWGFPLEEQVSAAGPRFPELKEQPNIWAADDERRRALICLDWRRPIIINMDDQVPLSFDDLVCFEINYIGLLLLQPVQQEDRQVYRRVGCAQSHRESAFFESSPEVEIVLV